MTLGEKLIQFRRKGGLTQKELSKKLRIPQCVISKIEHGKGATKETEMKIENGIKNITLDEKVEIFLEELAKDDKNSKEDKIKPNYYSLNIKGVDIEVMDIIEYVTKGMTGLEAFSIGNVIKYVIRSKNKNGLEDLKKAEEYLHRLILKKEKTVE